MRSIIDLDQRLKALLQPKSWNTVRFPNWHNLGFQLGIIFIGNRHGRKNSRLRLFYSFFSSFFLEICFFYLLFSFQKPVWFVFAVGLFSGMFCIFLFFRNRHVSRGPVLVSQASKGQRTRAPWTPTLRQRQIFSSAHFNWILSLRPTKHPHCSLVLHCPLYVWSLEVNSFDIS